MSRFFPTVSASDLQPVVQGGASYINVGGELFHALAVALVDYFKNTAEASRDDDAAIKKILESFYALFPKHINNQGYLTANERMRMLIKNARISELVECMAYTLRQITINEFYAHPLRLSYREFFMSLDKNISEEVLRDPATALFAHSAIDACANALGISILVNCVERDKELGKRLQYPVQPDGKLARCKIKLQAQNDRYFPKVIRENDFSYVGQLALKPVQPVETELERQQTVRDLIESTEADNQVRLSSYVTWHKNFLSMVKGEDLTAVKLRDLYIASIPVEAPELFDAGAFYSKLTKAELQPVTLDASSNEDKKIDLLSRALAALISMNKVDPSELLDQPDELTQRATAG